MKNSVILATNKLISYISNNLISFHFIFHIYPYRLTNQNVEIVILNTNTSTYIYKIAGVNQTKSHQSININNIIR
jgi:hypothetical protein